MNQPSFDPDASREDDGVLDPRDERALEDLVARLRAPHADGDPLTGFVDGARALDLADERTIEANLDAVYDAYAVTSGRVGTLDFLAARLRHSPLMRLVAASIAVHALGLPVLAYVTLKPGPEPPYELVFELPGDHPSVIDAPDEGLEALDAADLLDDAPLDGTPLDETSLEGGPTNGDARDDGQ